MSDEAPVWTMSADQYQRQRGVHQPWIAEISPAQFASMSERQKKRYQTQRAKEWTASASVKGEWRAAVLAAFDAGEVTRETLGLHAEAREAIRQTLAHRGQRAREAAFQAALDANRITGIEQVEVGARVFDIMTGRYGTVTKKHKVSVILEPEPGGYQMGAYKADVRRLQWQRHDDVAREARRG